jgi:hypothetical protein
MRTITVPLRDGRFRPNVHVLPVSRCLLLPRVSGGVLRAHLVGAPAAEASIVLPSDDCRCSQMRLTALLFLGLLPLGPLSGQASRLAIINVSVVDVDRNEVLPRQTVVIDGGRIQGIGASDTVRIDNSVRRIDGDGRYLVPGFWDMHGHLSADSTDLSTILPLYILNGITGVREMWSDPPGLVVDSVRGITMLQRLLELRADLDSSRVLGPRLLLTSAPLDGPFGPDQLVHVVRSAPEARRVVEESVRRGVDAINVFSGLAPAAYAAAGVAAREANAGLVGLPPVAATFAEMHAAGHRVRDGLWEWRVACSSLADSARSMLRAAAVRDAAAAEAPDPTQTAILDSLAPRLATAFDAPGCRRTAREVTAGGIWQAPRLVYSSAGGDALSYTRSGASLLPTALRENWRRAVERIEGDSTGARARSADRDRRIVRALVEAGVPLLVGTEAYAGGVAIWGFSVHDEMRALVDAGATASTALRAATVEPARALGRDRELGRVQTGFVADLVLLDANPLEDIQHTRRIHAVIVRGRLVDADQLSTLRAELAARAR